MLASLALFNDSFANIVTITFSALIFIELANVYSSVTHLTFLMLLASVFTLICYIASMIFLNNYFDTSYVNVAFIWKIAIIAGTAWVPVHFGIVLFECIDPPEEKKIRSGAK
jgi:phospholipid-translocating ATPase